MSANPTIRFKRKTSTRGAPASLLIGEPAFNSVSNSLYLGTTGTSAVVWVGAEIQDSTFTTFTDDETLATRKAIGNIFVKKTGTDSLTLSGAAEIRFVETGGGTDYVALKAPASVTSGNVVLTLPGEYPSANNYIIQSTTGGVLSWTPLPSASTVGITANSSNSDYRMLFTSATGTVTSASLLIDTADSITFNPSSDTFVLSGDIRVNGGDITTTAATFGIVNTAATTVNAFGAATTITMGDSTSATTNIRGGTIAGSTTTQNVFNEAFIVNAFTSSTSITIGDPTIAGSATIRNESVILGDIGGTLTSKTTRISFPNSNLIQVGTSPTITTTGAGTVTLFDTNATTVNAFGAATAITMGSSSGLTSIQHNLSVKQGTISTDAAIGNIFNTNISTLNLAGSATTINIGTTSASEVNIGTTSSGKTTIRNPSTEITGDLAVNGGDLTSTAATFNLLNSGVTTISFGGAATTANLFTSATTLNFGNVASGAQTVEFFSGSAQNSSYNLMGGNTANGRTKTISFGNNGDAGSTTTVSIGENSSGTVTLNLGSALGSTSLNSPTVNVGTTAGTINLGTGTNGTTINAKGNVTVYGDLTVSGTTTTVNSTTVTIDDLNIVLADGQSTTAGVDGAGITLGTTGITWQYANTGNNWASTENISIASGKSYKINNVSVLSAQTLGSSVTGSSLQSVGTISSGTWNGTAIGVAYGGTGLTSYTTGQVIYASGATTLAGLTASVTSGAVISSTGAGTAPEYKRMILENGTTTIGSGTITLSLDTIDGGTYA